MNPLFFSILFTLGGLVCNFMLFICNTKQKCLSDLYPLSSLVKKGLSITIFLLVIQKHWMIQIQAVFCSLENNLHLLLFLLETVCFRIFLFLFFFTVLSLMAHWSHHASLPLDTGTILALQPPGLAAQRSNNGVSTLTSPRLPWSLHKSHLGGKKCTIHVLKRFCERERRDVTWSVAVCLFGFLCLKYCTLYLSPKGHFFGESFFFFN